MCVCKLVLAFGKCNQDQPRCGCGFRLELELEMEMGLGLEFRFRTRFELGFFSDSTNRHASKCSDKIENGATPNALPASWCCTAPNKFNDLLVRKSATKAAPLITTTKATTKRESNNVDVLVLVLVVVQSSCSCASSKDLCGIWA